MIFHYHKGSNIITSNPDIAPEECKENLKHIHIIITLQYVSSRKIAKLATPHLMTFICQNKLYCAQNWQNSRVKKPPLLQGYPHLVNPTCYNSGFQLMFCKTLSAVPQILLNLFLTAVLRNIGFTQQYAKRASDFHVSTIVVDRGSINQ